MPTEPLGRRIRRLREEQGLTQTRLAELSGLAQSAIAMIESGARANPTVVSLRHIAGALGISLPELLDGTSSGGSHPAPNGGSCMGKSASCPMGHSWDTSS